MFSTLMTIAKIVRKLISPLNHARNANINGMMLDVNETFEITTKRSCQTFPWSMDASKASKPLVSPTAERAIARKNAILPSLYPWIHSIDWGMSFLCDGMYHAAGWFSPTSRPAKPPFEFASISSRVCETNRGFSVGSWVICEHLISATHNVTRVIQVAMIFVKASYPIQGNPTTETVDIDDRLAN